MFNIGFVELVIIIVVALMVVGPERLPILARQLGLWVRDAKRMYANMRAELGPEFDEIEQGIRELRSLDPRQQVRDYSRALLDDLGADVPEAKQLASAPKLNLNQLGRDLLRDDLLEQPLAEQGESGNGSSKDGAAPAPVDAPPSTNGSTPLPMTSSASDVPTQPRTGKPPTPGVAIDTSEIETTGHYE